MRKKIVAGNWKMNLNYTEGVSLFSEIVNMVNDEVIGNQKVVICSSFIHLSAISHLAKSHPKVSVGAQNCHQTQSGAYTGEVSASMIQSIEVKYVIIGHSERRQYFSETNLILSEKVDAALKHELTPIFCIGETLEQRNNNTHFTVLKSQLSEGVFNLDESEFKKLIIAYEPVWAIGTGLTASPEQAQEIHEFIRKEIAVQYTQAVADECSILYGGSCNSKNAAELFAKPDIDGGLIGGASLKSRDFVDIIKSFPK
ncbi:MAG: triose-phosphate isomerase [Flavobacterium sp.]|nr:triose-phosphate isomerase [Pedobacter sp.]